MTGAPMYAVDLEELLATIDDLGRAGDELDDVLAQVAARVTALQGTWSGRAAAAQRLAQEEWEAGFREMRAGISAMREAARVAHGRYGTAAATNLRMWEQVS